MDEGESWLQPEHRVLIVGLKDACQHNGKSGTVLAQEKERWSVRLDEGGNVLLVRAANLRPAERRGASGAPDEATSANIICGVGPTKLPEDREDGYVLGMAKAAWPSFLGLPSQDVQRRPHKFLLDMPRHIRAIFDIFDAGGSELCLKAAFHPDGTNMVLAAVASQVAEQVTICFQGLGKDTVECVTTFTGVFTDQYREPRAHHALKMSVLHECLVRGLSGLLHVAPPDAITTDSPFSSFLAQRHADEISRYLVSEYTSRKHWPELLELRMVLMSHAFARRATIGEIVVAANLLGEALEACGKHESAAKIYAEGAQHLARAGLPNATNMFNNSGLAWKHAHCWHEAVKAYMLSVHSRPANDAGDGSWSCWKNLASCFWAQDLRADERQGRICFALSGLLVASGASSVSFNSVLGDSACLSVIRPKLRAARIARAKLVSIASVEPSEMAAALSVCINPKINFDETLRRLTSGDVWDRRSTHHASLAREAADGIAGGFEPAGSRSSISEHNVPCATCNAVMEVGDFKRCQCRTVLYCDEECQRAHWREHKKVCSWYAAQRGRDPSVAPPIGRSYEEELERMRGLNIHGPHKEGTH